MFKQAIFGLLLTSAAAESLSLKSRKGKALLQHAKVIEPSRHLRQLDQQQGNQYNAYQYYQNEANYEFDISSLSIQYLGCSEWQSADQNWQENQYQQQMQYYYQNQEGNQQGENQQQEGEQEQYQYYNDGMDKSSLVRFTLCSDQECGNCSGEYAVDMVEFIDAYTESKMDALDYQCEMIRERCYCQNGNWEQCFYDCFQQAEFSLYGTDEGVQYCLNEYYGYEAFEVQAYLECQEMEQVEDNGQNQQYNYNNNNNGGNGGNYYNQQQAYNENQQQYYVGPYCKDNKYIYLGAFYDEDCSYPADNAKFQGQNYGGSSFPYFKESIIEPKSCIMCQETESFYQMKQYYKQQQYYQQQANNQYYNNNGDAQNNYNQYYNGEEMDYGDANEVCQSWEDAIKCDTTRGYSSGCNFLDNTLPTLDGRGKSGGSDKVFDSSVYDKLQRNKNSAIAMGVIAALLLGALAFMCGLCGGGGDPKKIALLEKKRMGEEEGQLA